MLPSPMPSSYRIDPNTSELDKALLEQRHIRTIPETFTDFVSNAKIDIPSVSMNHETFKAYQDTIPENFQDSFSVNPAPTLRLLSSWDYVNSNAI